MMEENKSKTYCVQLGKRIRQAREARSFTQQELAAKAGIHIVTLSKIESGKSMPNVETVGNIGCALQVSVDYLLGLSKEPDMVTLGLEEIISMLSECNEREMMLMSNLIVTCYRFLK